MYRFVKKHGKKLMAIFGAFLMVSFAASGMLTPGQGGGNPVVGRVGDDKIRGQDVFVARQDWQLLTRLPGGGTGQDGRPRPLSAMLGPQIEDEITRRPVLFLLLQKEAEQLGVTVSQDTLQTVLTSTPGLVTTDPDRNDQISRAVRSLLLVLNAGQRAASVIKVTDPMIEHQLAQVQQSITLDAVDFTTAKYIDQAKAHEPTAAEIKAHFEKYADTVAGDASEANPFGFGYKYPDRVKLQYIVVPRSDVRKAVEGSRTPYEWEVEARKYYRQNQAQFQTAPTTQPKQAFDLTAPASQPTTKPYDAVQQEVKDQLINDETERRMTAIRDRIVSTLGADWVAYRNSPAAAELEKAGAGATTQSSTAPTTGAATAGAVANAPESSQGVPYASFEYLQKLAQQIQAQKQFGVLPTAVSIADRWLTLDDLNKLPGVGQAQLNGVPMGSYVMSTAAPFIPDEQRKEGGWLRVMEPTRPMLDQNDSIYIVRISAADPSHKPATIAEVERQLRADLLTARAYELAKADATKTLEQARRQGLKDAAAGRGIVSVGPLTNRPGQVVPPLALTGAASDRFVNRAFKLLSTTRPSSPPAGGATGGASNTSAAAGAATATATGATTAPAGAVATTQGGGAATPRPVDLIELPRDGRVLVAQLGDVQAMWTERSIPMEEAQIHRALTTGLMQRFIQTWFSYDNVVARLNFVPEGNLQDLETGTPPQQPPPPIL